MVKRDTFGSKFGAIAVVGGSVVGLGNIWKFPYVAGENGGATFILIYILIDIFITLPLLLSEFSIGRYSQKNVLGAFRSLSPMKIWSGVGYLGVLTAMVILPFYSVIAGWSLEFIKESVLNNFAGQSAEGIAAHFDGFVASGWKPVMWTLLFLLFNGIVVGAGVQKGIEKASKILMPVLAGLLFCMAIGAAFLSGASEGYSFLFKPDWSVVDSNLIIQALGQSFFSMSIGMGVMITYGSYVNRRENLFQVACTVAVVDVMMAIMAGLAIFPTVFTYGINPSSGPELVFLTLPTLFAQISGGYIISILFFTLLLFAAITSTFSLFEVVIAYLVEECRVTRVRANVMLVSVLLVTASLCAMSQMPNSWLCVGGMSLFDIFDSLSANYMLPIGGLATVIFAGWFFDRKKMRGELTNGGKYGSRIFPLVLVMIKFVAPIAIVMMFLTLTGFI